MLLVYQHFLCEVIDKTISLRGKCYLLLILYIIFLYIWYSLYIGNLQLAIIEKNNFKLFIWEYAIRWSYPAVVSVTCLTKQSLHTREMEQGISSTTLDIIKEYCHPQHFFQKIFFSICSFESRIESLA